VRTQASADKKPDRKQKKTDGKTKTKKLNKTGVEATRPSVPLLKIAALPTHSSSSARKANLRDLSACKSSGRSRPESPEVLSPQKHQQRGTKAHSPEKKATADVGIPKSLRQHLQNIISKQRSDKHFQKKHYKSQQLQPHTCKKRAEASRSPVSKKPQANGSLKLFFSPPTALLNRDSPSNAAKQARRRTAAGK